MSILPVQESKATKVKVTQSELIIYLADGRQLNVPLIWFPKLLKASQVSRKKYTLIGNGIGIHWPDLDEDLSVKAMLLPNA